MNNLIILVFLQEKLRVRMLKENIEGVNQDLLIQNHYLHSNTGLFTQRPNLFNAQRLMQALKKRNEAYNQFQDAKFLPPLPQDLKEENKRVIRQAKINQYHREKQTVKDELEREWNNQLQWEKFTFRNQQQYVDQHQEYLIHTMIDSSFKGRNDIQKNVKGMVMNNLKKIKDRQVTMRSMIRVQNNQQTNKKKYLDFVKRKVLANQEKITGIDEFEHLDGEISRFWRILSEHIKSYQFGRKYQKPSPELALVYSSISLIQAQFRQQLSCLDSQKQISQFMRKRCILSSRDNSFLINQEGALIWSVPYAYYRAGDMPHFYISLNERGQRGVALREQFSAFHDSLTAFQPTVQRFAEDHINDIFYNQLVSIVKGYSLFDQRLCKIGSLDFIWLALKCLKTYQNSRTQKNVEVQQLKQALLQYFSLNQDKYMTKQASLVPYLQLLYLAEYQSIIWLKNHQKISHGLTDDDYLHFLLALYSNPQIINPRWNEKIMRALQKQLIVYLSILLDQKDFKEYAIFYLLEIPAQSFRNVVLSVFNSYQKYSQIDHCYVDGFKGWKYLKFRYSFALQSELFEDTVLTLLRNLLEIQDKPEMQMKIIQSAREILSDIQNFIDMVFECQCKHLLKLKRSKQLSTSSMNAQLQKEKADSKVIYRKLNAILQETAQNHEEIQQQYGWVIEFLDSYCILEDIMHDKNIQKLEQFIKNEKYVNNLGQLTRREQVNQNQDVFKKLQKLNGLELFFIYLKNIVYSQEKILYMRGKQREIQQFKKQILGFLSQVLKQGKYDIGRFKNYYDF